MDTDTFNHILNDQTDMCRVILVDKAKEYATEDRLSNFKKAAFLESCTVRRALSGMMAKHTVSIYDMCLTTEMYDMKVWDEKITDHINYLLLLKAVVNEEIEDQTQQNGV